MHPGRFRIMFATLAGFAIALTGCAGPTPENQETSAPELKLGVRGALTSWNPSQANVNDTQQIYQTVYDTLIRRTPEGELEPMLATQWTFDKSQKQLTVDLRDGVTFTDGQPFNSAAVVANLDNLKNGKGPQSNTVSNVERVEVVDDNTVTFVLSEPDPAFLIYLSGTAGFQASPAAIDSGGLDQSPVGTGPYVLDPSQSVTGSTYFMKAREGYWATELQKFSSVTYTVLTDATARLNALISGQVDAALVDVSMAAQAESSGLKSSPWSVDWSGFILQDREGTITPALADVRVRRAINMAIDREALVREILDGHGQATSQFFGASTPGYIPELDSHYKYDPDQAKSLLAEAGFGGGFAVTLPSAPTLNRSLLDVVTHQLSEVGISVTWQPAANWGAFVGEVSSGKYSMPLMNQAQGDTWVEVRKMLAPDALYNPHGYKTEVSERLISSLQTSSGDAAAFRSTAEELGRYLTEEAWFAPFYRFDMMYFHSQDIEVIPQPQVSAPSIYNYSPRSAG